MTEETAKALQETIYQEYPALPVTVRSLGGEYICFIAYKGYYLWSWDDWITYRDSHIATLRQYAREKRAC